MVFLVVVRILFWYFFKDFFLLIWFILISGFVILKYFKWLVGLVVVKCMVLCWVVIFWVIWMVMVVLLMLFLFMVKIIFLFDCIKFFMIIFRLGKWLVVIGFLVICGCWFFNSSCKLVNFNMLYVCNGIVNLGSWFKVIGIFCKLVCCCLKIVWEIVLVGWFKILLMISCWFLMFKVVNLCEVCCVFRRVFFCGWVIKNKVVVWGLFKVLIVFWYIVFLLFKLVSWLR